MSTLSVNCGSCQQKIKEQSKPYETPVAWTPYAKSTSERRREEVRNTSQCAIEPAEVEVQSALDTRGPKMKEEESDQLMDMILSVLCMKKI